MLINDYIIHEDLCNFKCEYCLGDELDDDYRNQINGAEKKLEKRSYSSISQKVMEQLEKYETYVDTDILQLSGGELFMIDGIIELIKAKSPHYKSIYILTNGYLLDEKLIEELSKIPNLIIGLSLDGHTLEMNSYRFKNEKILNKILDNLKTIIHHSIPLMVNSVLHKKNIKPYKSFLHYLASLSADICVMPISVRGNRAKYFCIEDSDLHLLADIANDQPLHKKLNIIPKYFEELYHILKSGKKRTGCWIPLVATEMFNTGNITPCPLYWVKDIGNIDTDNAEEIFSKIGEDSIYELLVKKPVRVPFCKKCFSSYDLINLYFEGEIDLKELAKVPIFNSEEILNKIKDLRGKYVSE